MPDYAHLVADAAVAVEVTLGGAVESCARLSAALLRNQGGALEQYLIRG